MNVQGRWVAPRGLVLDHGVPWTPSRRNAWIITRVFRNQGVVRSGDMMLVTISISLLRTYAGGRAKAHVIIVPWARTGLASRRRH